jgi:hypothetical protein
MPFVNPTLKIRCPYCLSTFHPGDCAIYSTSKPGKLLRQSPTRGNVEYVRSRTWIEDLTGPEFTTEMAVRQCPFCKQMLFEGIETCENINITIIGDIYSGKTHYIATLIDQLKRGVLTQNGNSFVQLRPLNEYTNKTYRDAYYKPIIQDHTTAIASLTGRYDAQGSLARNEPLVYRLVIQENSSGTPKMLNLLLYNLSGEDFADNTSLAQSGEHGLQADGIIYLADPLSMPHITQQIPTTSQLPVLPSHTAGELLSAVLYRLEQYNRVRLGGTVSTPTAITISKADFLQYVIPQQERSHYWLMHQPAYDGKAHLDDIQHVDQEVRSILYRYGETALLQISKRFDDVSFFAISATGNAPDSTGKYPYIEPHRCLDPFIWLLWKLKFLPAVK